MKRFKFRLERVLQLREAAKAEKQRELALANKALADAEEELAGMIEAFNGAGMPETVMTAAEVFLRAAYLGRLKEAIAKQCERIEGLKGKAAEAREAYRVAASEAEALKSLKAKKLEEFEAVVKREEGKFLDELAVMRGARSED